MTEDQNPLTSRAILAPVNVLKNTTDALENMLGAYDTPVSRRRYPPDDFMKECISTARAALVAARASLDAPVPSENILAPSKDDLWAAIRKRDEEITALRKLVKNAEQAFDEVASAYLAGDNNQGAGALQYASGYMRDILAMCEPVPTHPKLEPDLTAENIRLREALSRICDSADELIEVADLRGDNSLPHPADDPKTWTARMQEAWNDIDSANGEARAALEVPSQTMPSTHNGGSDNG